MLLASEPLQQVQSTSTKQEIEHTTLSPWLLIRQEASWHYSRGHLDISCTSERIACCSSASQQNNTHVLEGLLNGWHILQTPLDCGFVRPSTTSIRWLIGRRQRLKLLCITISPSSPGTHHASTAYEAQFLRTWDLKIDET